MKQIDIYNIEGMLNRLPERIEVIRDSLTAPLDDVNAKEVFKHIVDLADEVKDMQDFAKLFVTE